MKRLLILPLRQEETLHSGLEQRDERSGDHPLSLEVRGDVSERSMSSKAGMPGLVQVITGTEGILDNIPGVKQGQGVGVRG